MKEFLLVPVMPTPNGPLHLGHIAGPFLKMDVLAKSLKQDGHKVTIISASDSWETHVLLRARSLGATPAEICCRFHGEIIDSLRAMEIHYDEFINPLEFPFCNILQRINYRVIANLETKQATALRVLSEQVPYSTKYRQPLVGALVEGTCPRCGSAMGGFYCEHCATEISPGALMDLRSRLSDDTWEWRSYRSLFLQVTDEAGLRAVAGRACRDHRFVDLALESLGFNKRLIRLTHPGSWGIPYSGHGVSQESVFFSYSALLGLTLLCAHYSGYGDLSAATGFAVGEKTATITSFGVDNSSPYLGAVLGQMILGGLKPFDHCLTNYFGTLDGKKFSTSRNHVIWATEATSMLGASVDTIRAFLAWINPQHGETDFSFAQFARFKQEWEDDLCRMTAAACVEGPNGKWDQSRFMKVFSKRQAALEPASFALADAVDAIRDWIQIGKTGDLNQEWALAFAVLAYPVLPSLAQKTWLQCGQRGLPRADVVYSLAGECVGGS
jgi:methionyl-tRNA synthetase